MDSQHVFSPTHKKSKALTKKVIRECKRESASKNLNIPLVDFVNRASQYTGLPEEYIRMLAIERDKKECLKDLTIVDRRNIWELIKNVYSGALQGDYREMFKIIETNDIKVSTIKKLEFPHFLYVMKTMGYYPIRVNDSILPIENPKNFFERYYFLTKMKKLRESRASIYYFDTRWVDETLTFKRAWLKKCGDSFDHENSFVVFYVMSETGTMNILFNFQANGEDFNKWVVNLVLPNLSQNSILVMDKNPLHYVRKKSKINYYSRNEMLEWLTKRNVPCGHHLSKAELYHLIQKYPIKEGECDLDQMVRAHGHTVMRLPTGLTDVSPTDLLWKLMATCDRVKESAKHLSTLRNNVFNELHSLMATYSIKYVESTIKLEEEILDIHKQIENLFEDNFQINTEDIPMDLTSDDSEESDS